MQETRLDLLVITFWRMLIYMYYLYRRSIVIMPDRAIIIYLPTEAHCGVI